MYFHDNNIHCQQSGTNRTIFEDSRVSYLAQDLHPGVQQFPSCFVVNGLGFVVNHGVFTHDPEIRLHQQQITHQVVDNMTHISSCESKCIKE